MKMRALVITVYHLESQQLRFVAPMPDNLQNGPVVTATKMSSQKSIVVVPICSGMDATNLIFKARTDLRSLTINLLRVIPIAYTTLNSLCFL